MCTDLRGSSAMRVLVDTENQDTKSSADARQDDQRSQGANHMRSPNNNQDQKNQGTGKGQNYLDPNNQNDANQRDARSKSPSNRNDGSQ